MNMIVKLMLAFLLCLSSWAAPTQAKALAVIAAKIPCEDLANRVFTLGSSAARITSTTLEDSPPAARSTASAERVPTCHVTGYVAPQVKFDLRLPLLDWRQRLVFMGCGGFCGSVYTRAWATWNCLPLERGEFAVVTSDLGHATERSDGVWAVGNPQGVRDFGSRGVHVVLLATRKIMFAFYGQLPRFSYFNGCSDGGREALMAAQRFPDDFDGIVAGAPALNLTANNSIYHAWNAQQLLSADGEPLFSRAQLNGLHAEVLRQCDALDGSSDGVIADPLACQPQLDGLRCDAEPGETCLSDDQIARVFAVYAGPTHADGRRLYHGAPVGSEKYWYQAQGSVQYALNFTSFMTGAEPPEPVDVWSIDYADESLQRYNRLASELNATDTNLEAFRAAGGKLLMWHGWSDNSIPPTSTTQYVAAVRQRLGAQRANSFLRLFMIPGMAHCTGGDGPHRVNFLEPLMGWVEDGVAPEAMPATGDQGKPGWTLYPYEPQSIFRNQQTDQSGTAL